MGIVISQLSLVMGKYLGHDKFDSLAVMAGRVMEEEDDWQQWERLGLWHFQAWI